MSITEVLKIIIEEFTKAGIENPGLDAEVISAFVLKTERYRIVIDHEREISSAEEDQIRDLAKRRCTGEPVAYLTESKEFYSLRFTVNRHVLIPRPETELLVDLAIFYAGQGSRVLDIGTGSGAIAVALKYYRPDLNILASDISEKALEVAEKNANEILGKSSITFVKGDLFNPLHGLLFDMIITNPPYIDPEDKEKLQKEIGFEPEVALFSGNRGREIINRCLSEAGDYLNPGAKILMEIGSTQKDYIIDISNIYNYAVSVMNDYSGLPRIAIIQK